MFTLNSEIVIKRLEPADSCARDQYATTAPARHNRDVRDGIFKLSPIYLSDSLNFLNLPNSIQFNAPFRKNSIN